MGTEFVSQKGSLGFRNITKKYGDLTVVDKINLDIKPGEFFSLLGPSGSGKTTTLMMLAGFAAPDSGQIFLDDTDISRLSPQQRNLGMVFQNYALFPHMSVLDNVMFPLKVRKYSSKDCLERAQWAIDLVRLSNYSKRLPKELSGGQQQRVALARAVVFHPEVVLMDEPLGALDKNLRYQMQMEIKELQRKLNMTVVFVTHDQEEAMNMSDRIAIMNNGRIEQLGGPKEVYESPCNVFAAGFLGEANILPCGDLDPRYSQHMNMRRGDCLFIRPERVVLSNSAADGDMGGKLLTGQILSISFLGNIIRYQVKINETVKVYADSTNLSDIKEFSVGDRVVVGWSRPEDIRIIHHD
ncbi:ABC transporter ATP-binding protein [Paralcaligenes sp. KSB-10]|uniref:ABC transporter ATP-binding protein n=1 Tax=Paralcaligenes sp. KSB-10 TaxID=2901142 RepID=UPI001E3224F4|nr:ABC transporter ATP-binding protein [Paralcaligenes sp. KSB-10]UHL62992.1 ABC transporter ATP-binding protein [Paralcaligenes sp. KSB-10]